MDALKTLIGTTINRVFLNSDTDIITFDTDKGLAGFVLFGDCCSSSYFHEITGVEKILGQKITSVEEIPNAEETFPVKKFKEDSDEYIEVYGYRISTDPVMEDIKGIQLETSRSMILVFRNSSNGYYGGSIEKTTATDTACEELKTDWHAKTS